MHRFTAKLIATALLSGLAAYGQSYWLATVHRTPTDITYTYNVKAPDYFVPWLLATNERGGGRSTTKTVNGQTYTFIPQFFSWDTNGSSPVRTGQIRIDNRNERWRSDAWKIDQKLKTDSALIALLDAAANPAAGGPWREADLLALRWDGAGAPGLTYTEAIPVITQLRNKLSSFNSAPTRPGTYYSSVQVPADLDQVRALMLEYGNTGRRDPDFRKNNGAKTATNLSGPTVATIASRAEEVKKDNPTPPYFKDHVLDPNLNEMAQFQAEYQASRRQMGHDGPFQYRDPKTGKTVNMSGLGERAAFFGVQGVVEAAGMGTIETFPHAWMSGETHFRPWFNVVKFTDNMGYGVAKGSDGNWYFAAVPTVADSPASAAPAVPPAPQTGAGNIVTEITQSPRGSLQGAFVQNGYALQFQADGNVCLNKGSEVYGGWCLSEEAAAFKNTRRVTVANGTLHCQDAAGNTIWRSTPSQPGAGPDAGILEISPEGQMTIVDGAGKVYWSKGGNRPAATPAPAARPFSMKGTGSLVTEVTQSPRGSLKGAFVQNGYALQLQADGNVCLNKGSEVYAGWCLSEEAPSTYQNTRRVTVANGMLHCQDAAGNTIWRSTPSQPGADGDAGILKISPQGRMTIVDTAGKVYWSKGGSH